MSPHKLKQLRRLRKDYAVATTVPQLQLIYNRLMELMTRTMDPYPDFYLPLRSRLASARGIKI